MSFKFIDRIMSSFIVRWWLKGILLILPFHFRIVQSLSLSNPGLANYVDKLEEITLVVFLPFAIIELFLKGRNNNYRYLALSIPFLIFSVSGYVSGIVEGNSLLITTHGIFHYLKYFLVVFIYAAFFRNFAEFKKVFRLLLIIAVFLVIVGFVQEIWAIISRYIMDKNIDDHSVYILCGASTGSWRFSIYRAPSLIGHYNILGLYSLLIMTVYLSTVKKVKYSVVLALFGGVFVSVSRMIYIGAMLIAGFEIFKRRLIMFLILIPFAVMLFFMRSMPDFDVTTFSDSQVMQSEEISSGPLKFSLDQYRLSAREKAFEVWKDNPVLGVGPGMFGSEIASKYHSPVYSEYNFDSSLKWFQTLDQFWPQALAETGIIGAGVFAGLLLTLFFTFAQNVTRVTTSEVKGLFTGLMIYMIVIIIYSLGGVLNHPSILFTYCALAGMCLGCEEIGRNNEQILT